MRSILAAIYSIVVMLAPAARADWEYARWGMTTEQVTAASKGGAKALPAAEREKDDTNHEESRVAGILNDGGLRMNVRFTFDTETGGLKCVYYDVPVNQAAAFKAWMIKRYGNPQRTTTMPGPKTGTDILTWTAPDQIDLVLKDGQLANAIQCAS